LYIKQEKYGRIKILMWGNYMKNNDNTILVEIRKKLLASMLIITALASFAATLINTINQRPLSNIAQPFVAFLFTIVLYILLRKKKGEALIKLSFLLFFNVFYIPFTWPTSPGSYSAIAFYSLLIIIITSIQVEKRYETIFPLITVSEVIYMFYYEAINPDKFYKYVDLIYRAGDLSVNYFIISMIILYTVYTINKHFNKEHTMLYIFSTKDYLTGLYNRAKIFEILELTKKEQMEKGKPFGILMIDLNNLKPVNDIYGHLHGDRLLKSFAKIVENNIGNSCSVGRYGGDEFLIVLRNECLSNYELLEKNLREDFEIMSKEYPKATTSLAIGVCTDNTTTTDEMIIIADIEMYKNKLETKSTKE
jgi:diguanylate cyclase (GGDEF)-like protein